MTRTNRLNKDDLLKMISEEEILSTYLGKSLRLPATIISPFRKEDNASFTIYYKNNHIRYHDKASGEHGDIISLVMNILKCDYSTALHQVNANHKSIVSAQKKDKYVEDYQKQLSFVLHKKDGQHYFPEDALAYWQQFNINAALLKRNNVLCVDTLLLNNRVIDTYSVDNPIFLYLYPQGGKGYHKVYRPKALKQYKFLTDFKDNARFLIHGIRLIKSNEPLIITKSAKDCMTLQSLGFNSVATQSENTVIPNEVIAYLRTKCPTLYILYDNDWNKSQNWGQLNVQKLSTQHNLINICIPNEYKCTDIAEVVVNHGIENAKNLINKYINI